MAAGVPFIPYKITVHLGSPSSDAQNVAVQFSEYIKNVASSEIYPTWDEDAIEANVYAQISYALNRVYTEYYRSRGYPYDITASPASDQKFIYNRDIFQRIDRIVSNIFNIYTSRIGNLEPLAAKYCNGTTVTCDGLSQWGSESLAQQGLDSFEILRRYYGYNIELVDNAPMRAVTDSYPGTSLKLGSRGNNVTTIQTELNRISQNYPSIPKLAADGIFGPLTESAVKIFQRIFNLVVDGIVGKATWYKLVYLYVGVARLSELDSEGVRLFNASLEYPDAISQGDTGEKVLILQYFLALIADFYPTVATVPITGTFGPETLVSVESFQQQFDLPQTGVVDDRTWDELYNVFKGIYDTTLINEEIFPVTTMPFGGETLSEGATGVEVQALQEYLNVISLQYTSIPPVVPTGEFGPRTTDSVKAYQTEFGLPVTGVVGRVDWNSIVNTYKDVISKQTPRPIQYPGRVLKLGDKDE